MNEAITEGSCVIQGMSSYEEAEQLASYIRIGGLDLQLEESAVGDRGSPAGAGRAWIPVFWRRLWGLIVVMVFMIAVYRIPGVAAALALALYTELMLAILSLLRHYPDAARNRRHHPLHRYGGGRQRHHLCQNPGGDRRRSAPWLRPLTPDFTRRCPRFWTEILPR